ncbi:MAG: hypothetical protein R2705_09140 [Ilumatobacteraceae bacterium]
MDADALGRELPKELAEKLERDAERAKGPFSIDCRRGAQRGTTRRSPSASSISGWCTASTR